MKKSKPPTLIPADAGTRWYMLNLAKAYAESVDLVYRRSDEVQEIATEDDHYLMHFSTVAMMNHFFGMELILKHLIAERERTYPSIHAIAHLFEYLSLEDQQKFVEVYNPAANAFGVTCAEYLEAVDQGFVRSRYYFSGDQSEGLYILQHLLHGLIEYAFSKTSMPTTAGPGSA